MSSTTTITCALCHRTLLLSSSSSSSNDDHEDNHNNNNNNHSPPPAEFIISSSTNNICGDCNFLFMEVDQDLNTSSSSPHHDDFRTHSSSTRTRSRRITTTTRHDDDDSSEYDYHDAPTRLHLLHQQLTTSPTTPPTAAATPAPSRRYTSRTRRRLVVLFSDTESDGSVYSSVDESNNINSSSSSFRRFRLFHHGAAADTDTTIAGGGVDSDDADDDDYSQSFFGNNHFDLDGGPPTDDLDTDDIDPMNAGLYHWRNSQEDDDNDDDDDDSDSDSEWEEEEEGGDTIESSSTAGQAISLRRSITRQLLSPENGDTFPLRIGTRRSHQPHITTTSDDDLSHHYAGRHSGNYLIDEIGLDNLLEHLAETESLRRGGGAPPASVSFVHNMPCKTISTEDDDDNLAACAVCKESLTVGVVVNQLPCFHLYHPSCILPWLTSRNTCPLCRYELPTDDRDYEEMKRSRSRDSNGYQTTMPHYIHHQNYASSLDDTVADDQHEPVVNAATADSSGDRRDIPTNNRWFVLAAPVVSMVSISLMLWLGNRTADRRWRRENGQRRWWSFL